MDEDDHRSDRAPAGFIEIGDDLMPYWTRDGRSIEEIWEDIRHEIDRTDDAPF